jgi:mRNA interferase MazF
MPIYSPGEVVLLTFPYTDAVSAKQRPALVVLDVGDDDVLVARITSRAAATRFDVELGDWQQAGLLLQSTVRLHKLATVEKRLVKRKLGTLSAEEWQRIRAVVASLWNVDEP